LRPESHASVHLVIKKAGAIGPGFSLLESLRGRSKNFCP
jgi:hypothetical protein